MLSNAYFLAKFRFDTAENEPAKNLKKFAKFANFADPNPPLRQARMEKLEDDLETARILTDAHERDLKKIAGVAKFWQNFVKISFVFGCIGADLCN